MSTPEPDRCPKCDRPENVKEVCKHCGYEYPEENSPDLRWYEIALIVGVVSFATYAILTFGYWMVGGDWGKPDPTLVEVLESQWQWIKELCGRIV
ncbi:MAG: hypothetical protein Q8O19_06480 [Rectinemataceae bacterium]|nr:hypothetical protein [Rectinemataceae bacterium]